MKVSDLNDKFLWGILLLLLNITISAQYTEWQNISSGLNLRKIEKENNTIWAATEAGLARYDISSGTTFIYDKTNSPMKTNSVNSLLITREGIKWISTSDYGVYKFDNNEWINYNTLNSPLPENNVQTIIADTGGVIWIGTLGGGLVKYKDSQWTVYDSTNAGVPVNYIYSLACDNYGYIWIGTSSDGLIRFDGGSEWVLFSTDNTPALKSNTIRCIKVDSAGVKWFGTESGPEGGLYKFDGSQFTLYSTGSFSRNIWDIAFDKNGKIWVASYGGGLARYEGGTAWSIFNKTNSAIGDNALKSVTTDQSGNIWVGSEKKGLIQYDGSIFKSVNLGILPNNSIFSMAKDPEGNIWIGSKNYLTRMTSDGPVTTDLNDFLINPSPQIPPNFNVWAIAFDNAGNRYIGTYDGGMVKFNSVGIPRVFNRLNSQIPSDNVYSIAVDNQGIIWVGTASGLGKFDGTNWIVYNTTNSQLPNNYISSLAIDKQNKLWIATNNGVAKFDGVNWTKYSTSNGLPSNYTFYVSVDNDNNKWVGTGNGLAKFNGTSWSVFNTSNSPLPANQIQFVKPDSTGSVWIGSGGFGTGYGITKYNSTDWVTFKTENSGLSGNSVSSMLTDAYGNTWIGTFSNGISLYKPGGVTGIETGEDHNPLTGYYLRQNYPNPFNPSTEINFRVTENVRVTLTVFDINGRLVEILVDGYPRAGNHTAKFNAAGLTSGVYFAVLHQGQVREVIKMTFLK